MKTSKVVTVLLTAIVVGCGGGGGGTVAGIDGGGALPPVATTITAQGVITGFGSVIVNGIRFDTSSSEIIVDGSSGTQSDLAVGQVVIVQGSINDDGVTGTADRIIFDDVVEGPIESIDQVTETLVVLGQTVIINGDTAFEVGISPASVDGLSVGDTVEISGFRDSNGNVIATFVDFEDTPSGFEVTGFVSNVDIGAMSFTIHGLTVDYSGALVNDFPGGQPEDGQLVEAKGNALGGAGELIANEIEFKGNDLTFNNGDNAEVEGLITRFASATDFDVAGIPVSTTTATVFDNGSIADLALDRKVEVEGDFNTAGVLVADRVDFRLTGDLRAGGSVEEIQSDNFTIFGLQVHVDVGTELDDKSDQDIENFGFDDLNVGDYIEVRMFDRNGQLTATRLEREDDPGSVFLRGFVDSVSDPNFSILGITIQTNTGTEFRDAGDAAIPASTFFANADGRLVDAEGALSNGMIIADRVEFEN